MTSLGVLTLNLGLLAWRPFGLRGISIDRHIDERLAAAPAHLRTTGADVVALQEVYSSRHRSYLRKSLIDAYPYAFVPGKARSLLGSGLMFLSRHPIVEARSVLRNGSFGLHDAISEKACLSIEIDLHGYGSVRFLNVHLSAASPEQSSQKSPQDSDRFADVEHILAVACEQDRAHFMLGDFNCSPTVDPAFYQRILAAGFIDAFAQLANPEAMEESVTWDNSNAMNSNGRHRMSPSQLIDHVFVPTALSENVTLLGSRIEFNMPAIAVGATGLVTLSDHYGLSVRFALK